jgi:small subunit ribosomal protein S1
MSQDVLKKPTENQSIDVSNFDWDAYSADCPSALRKVNKHVKAPAGVKVYSREPYAQELLNLMESHWSENTQTHEVHAGETHTGKVYAVDMEWASIDIGYREMVYVQLSKESAISRAKLIPGTEIAVEITAEKSKSTRGFLLGSVEAGIKAATLREILASAETGNTAYMGTVTSMIPGGGYFVNVQGVDCFMPGSLAGINKLADFGSVINTQMYVVPMSYSPEKGTVIVSHRKYLQALIPNAIEALRNNAGETKEGNVTGSTKYGVFVEFDGCLTGMIHANDLNPEMARKHKAREINPGDVIEFKIKEIINNDKITLTQLEHVEINDPWADVATKYKSFPVEVKGTIKSVKDYGVFVDIGDGIVGLLHVSELPDNVKVDSLVKNDNITVQITRMDVATRKVFLKL